MKEMKKICKKLTTVVLAAAISVLAAATSYAQEYTDGNAISDCEHSEEYQELGYIPDARLGTPAVFSSPDRSFGYIFYQYPDGSYFSKTGEACTCHEKGCDPYKDDCNCIQFENAKQCAGFAKKVYKETHGYSLPATFITKNMLFTSCEQAKKLFNHNNTSPEATYLRVNTIAKSDKISDLNHKYDHSIIIVFSTNEKVTVYHANYGEACKVRYEDYSWDNFIKAFPYLYRYTD